MKLWPAGSAVASPSTSTRRRRPNRGDILPFAESGGGDNKPIGHTLKIRTQPLFSSSGRWLRHWRLGLLVWAIAAPGAGLAAENAVPVPKGYIDAMSWYARAARAGDPRAQYYMGVIHWRGLRGEKNHESAADWFEKAARKSHGPAQFSLGLAFELGLGRAKDAARAARWYRPAARQGIAEAAFNLGSLHERGDGVESNPAQAAIFYRQAAQAGLARAQYNLGLLYGEGHGVPRDRVRAWVWLSRANDAGYAGARAPLAALEKVMGADERSRAGKAYLDKEPR